MGPELEKFMINALRIWVEMGYYDKYIESISEINSTSI